MRMPFSALCMLFISCLCNAQVITTIAGTGTFGYGGDGGPATGALLEYAWHIVGDATGSVYFVDNFSTRVRKVDAAGIITTVAGTGLSGSDGDGGPASVATLGGPIGIAIDSAGNIFISDPPYNRIRKVDAAGIITTVAGTGTPGYSGDGGLATAAQIKTPYGLAADRAGNIFIADVANNRVRKIDAAGIITTIAGTGVPGFSGDGGPATLAQMSAPNCIAIDASGNLYVASVPNQRVRKIDLSGVITTIAGNGTAGFSGDGSPATDAMLNAPEAIAIDAAGKIYISEWNNSRIRRVDPATGIINTFAGIGTAGYSGDEGLATAAELNQQIGICFDRLDNMYISDWRNSRIRKIATTNIAPAFIAGINTALTICAPARILDTALSIVDTNIGQHITWSLQSPPLHGVASVGFTSVSTGMATMPAGTTYTPASGYIGTDTFKVRVTDGILADTIIIALNIMDCPSSVGNVTGSNYGIRITPNPADNGIFSFLLSAPNNLPTDVIISDITGRHVGAYSTTTNVQASIHLVAPAGLYFLQATTARGTWNTRIIIK